MEFCHRFVADVHGAPLYGLGDDLPASSTLQRSCCEDGTTMPSDLLYTRMAALLLLSKPKRSLLERLDIVEVGEAMFSRGCRYW